MDFGNYFRYIIPNGRDKRIMQNYLDQNQIGKWEQMIIDYVINSSYSNIKKIKKVYEDIFNVVIEDIENKMEVHFNNRHIMAHKNGRLKDGSFMNIGNLELKVLISDSKDFIQLIMQSINV